MNWLSDMFASLFSSDAERDELSRSMRLAQKKKMYISVMADPLFGNYPLNLEQTVFYFIASRADWERSAGHYQVDKRGTRLFPVFPEAELLAEFFANSVQRCVLNETSTELVVSHDTNQSGVMRETVARSKTPALVCQTHILVGVFLRDCELQTLAAESIGTASPHGRIIVSSGGALQLQYARHDGVAPEITLKRPINKARDVCVEMPIALPETLTFAVDSLITPQLECVDTDDLIDALRQRALKMGLSPKTIERIRF